MKNNKIMQAAPVERNSTATAAGADAEGCVVRDDLSEGDLASIWGGSNLDLSCNAITTLVTTGFGGLLPIDQLLNGTSPLLSYQS